MTATRITVDDTTYRVLVEYDSLKRSFEIMEGGNSGTAITGRSIRDILGTVYKYEMTVRADPSYPLDYDSFFYKISEPADYHMVTLPFGQSIIRFQAKITDGSDVFKGFYNQYQRWDTFELKFDSMEPQRIDVKEDITSFDIDVSTPVFNSLPATFYSQYFVEQQALIENAVTMSNLSAMNSDWSVTCHDGYIVVDGTMYPGQSTSLNMSLRVPQDIITLSENPEPRVYNDSNYKKIDIITPEFSLLPVTFYSRYITSDHTIIENSISLSNKDAMDNDWTFELSSGTLTIDGEVASGQSTSVSMSLRVPSEIITLRTSAEPISGNETISSFDIDVVTPMFSSLPRNFYSKYITSDHVMIENSATLSNEDAIIGDWRATCGDGYIRITGSMASGQSTSISMSLRVPRIVTTASVAQ